jgi:hypothetical protein
MTPSTLRLRAQAKTLMSRTRRSWRRRITPSDEVCTATTLGISVILTQITGGAGNIHNLTKEEQAEAKEHNKHVRANSHGKESHSKERRTLQELAEKGKEKLFGHKENKS